MHPSPQHKNTIQTGTTDVHIRLAVQIKPQGRDEEVADMNIKVNAIESCTDMPDYMRSEEIKSVTINDEHLSIVSDYVLCGLPSVKAEVQKNLQPYWLFRDEIVITYSITMKGK